jgi:hypothetical protein
MADGNPLLIGRNNNGNLSTVLARSGAQSNSAFVVTNTRGKGVEATATGNGVEASSTDGAGVRGVGRPIGVDGVGQSATRREIDSVGVRGTGYRGVYGIGSYTGSSRFHYEVGVFGESQGRTGTGVIGTGGTGVIGDGTTTGVRGTGTITGVEGNATEIEGVGVFGGAPRGFGMQGDGGILGVFGRSAGVNGAGVVGNANQGVGVRGFGNIGVSGNSNASHGVFGQSTAPELENSFVGGVVGQSNQFGVIGESTGQKAGVFGRANDFQGVGVQAFSAGIGVLAKSPYIAAWFDGAVQIVGDLFVQGNKSAVLRDSAGKHRRLYAVESPESWFEDFGFAKLVRGRKRVAIKRDFAQFIHTRDYYVFLTPEGDSNGLYVTKKSAAGFEVVEQQGGRSNTRFSYRIVAKRRDLRSQRLEAVRMPKISQKFGGRIAAPKLPRHPGPTKKLR